MTRLEHDAATNESVGEVRLRISVTKLLPLFLSGELRAEDFRCLDVRSRNLIRRLLLSVCCR
jgi:hypothetical protein